ncbi:arginine--tRNA ligase [Pedobacter arcticus]|uniref:arginine--tRNA ligase n=1 Tax=Pedobacter arcticus TaxID=752140 RepID=UPI000301F7CE|nr:arginine--tRNA ligase [Pedobacter arcticus]
MKFLQQAIVKAFADTFETALQENQINLEQTKKEFEGHATFVVFPFVKHTKKSPEQTANLLGEYLQTNCEEIESFNVIKGFLNLVLSDAYWLSVFKTEVLADSFGSLPKNGEKVMVEYSSPNTNKPLHLGHVRNNLLGFSVSNLLDVAGFEVIKVNLVNDRGIHICKSMLAWQKFGNSETPESAGLKGDHLVGKYYVIFDQQYKQQITDLVAKGKTEDDAKKQAPLILEAQQMLLKWEQGDEKVISLWKTMNSWVYAGFDETYKKLGVSFDKYYYESDTYLLGKDIVEEGLQKGVFFKKEDGSVWIDLTADGLDEKLVRRADGTSVYITQDLGTAQLKYDDFKVDKSIYVVGNEQDYHFKVLFLILEKLGKDWAKGLYHLSYGMVDLPSGKMKSREGTVVDADDLIDEMKATAKEKTEALGKVDNFEEIEKDALYQMIGMGALKYFLLKVEPKKRLLFDPNESIDFQGNTGPFIQYTHARIKSVLKKADFNDGNIQYPTKLGETEVELLQALSKYPETILQAAKDYNPAAIANFAYDLAKTYNKFYQTESILKVEDDLLKAFRLQLSLHTARTLNKAMAILGIEMPERM